MREYLANRNPKHSRSVKDTNKTAMLLICTLGAALIGFLSGFLLDAFSDLMLAEWLTALIYTLICMLSGLCLFLLLFAQTKNRTQRLIRNWAVLLWSVQFLMFLIAPAFSLVAAYVWLSILASILTALSVLCFNLRILGALTLLPVLAWIIFCCYAIMLLVG